MLLFVISERAFLLLLLHHLYIICVVHLLYGRYPAEGFGANAGNNYISRQKLIPRYDFLDKKNEIHQ
ncbi:hypothetical protein Trydic_g23947 [Trypoxylus dichotomus]